MYLDAILSSNVFETFTESLIIRDCDGTSVVDIIVVKSFVVFVLLLNVLL